MTSAGEGMRKAGRTEARAPPPNRILAAAGSLESASGAGQPIVWSCRTFGAGQLILQRIRRQLAMKLIGLALAGLLAGEAFGAGAGLRLLAIGDWGGENDEHPTTQAQIEASAGMSKLAKDINAAGVLLLGDNFYTEGVQNSSSARFKDTFEQVYPPSTFGQLPFYVVAGNHVSTQLLKPPKLYVLRFLRPQHPYAMPNTPLLNAC
jgi:hypothetical protein